MWFFEFSMVFLANWGVLGGCYLCAFKFHVFPGEKNPPLPSLDGIEHRVYLWHHVFALHVDHFLAALEKPKVLSGLDSGS